MRKRVGTLCITAAILLNTAGCGTDPSEKNEIRFSWWGGESRHKATSDAVDAFMQSQSEITVRCEYGAWSGWEDAAAAALYAGGNKKGGYRYVSG